MTEDGFGTDSSKNAQAHSDSIREYVSELICHHSSSREFDAQQILRENPEVQHHRSLVLDLAYEEYCRKVEQGIQVDQKEFAKKFPAYEDSLLRVLQVHQYLEKQGSAPNQKIAWPKPGDVFAGYELLERIGCGSFAQVFIAKQIKVADRKVVLKVTRNAHTEVETLGQLDHPNIVEIYTVDAGDDGLTAICMPLISRVTLSDVIGEFHGQSNQKDQQNEQQSQKFVDVFSRCRLSRKEDPLDPGKLVLPPESGLADTAFRVSIDVAQALAYSHAKGFLHCDIKPTNILITPEGQAMLFDFNLAAKSETSAGRIGGTLPYMAPEQLRALVDSNFDFEATPAVDLYSFGVTLYQLLTGELPFGKVPEFDSQKETAEFLLERQKTQTVSLDGVKNLSPGLKQTICKCLSLDPEDRPESADELVRLLQREKNLVNRTRRWVLQHPLICGLMLLVAISLIPLSMVLNRYLNGVPRAELQALLEQGMAAERDYRNGDATNLYRQVVELAKYDREMRYQGMGHLVIAFSRYETDVTKYMPYVEQMYEEFPEYTGFTLQIELALLAARRWLPKEHINEFTIMMHRLDQFGIQSPDRQNNYLVIKNTFEQSQLKKKKFQLKSMLSVRQEFRKILESYPDHRQAMLNYLELSRELAKKWESDVEIDFAVSSILDRFPDCDGVLQALVDLIAEERAHVPCTNEERLELIRLYLAAGGIETRVQTIQARLPKELQERISRMPRLPASKQKQNFDIRPGVVNPFHPYERSRTRN